MDIKKIIQEHELSDFPIGLQNEVILDPNFEPREYLLVVFDEKSEPNKIVNYDNEYVIIHHASLSEIQSKKLLLYDKLQIIQDESWDLRMLLSKINERRESLYIDYAKNCLIESMFCCQQTRESVELSNVFAPCWQKCASYFLADAICSLNHKKPNPFHMLYFLRNFDQNLVNKHITVATQTVGIERATPTLLDRMLKSTIGFSNITEKNDHHKIIQKKHDFFVKNSMLSDCYFYLGYVNKENFVSIKNTLNRQEDLIHILKIAFDVEADSHLLLQCVDSIQNSCNTLLETFSRY